MSLRLLVMNYYRDTKAIGTKEAIKFASENVLNLTILEPTWVYGEKEFNTGFYSYLQTVKTGIPFFLGSKKNMFSVIYAEDLARTRDGTTLFSRGAPPNESRA